MIRWHIDCYNVKYIVFPSNFLLCEKVYFWEYRTWYLQILALEQWLKNSFFTVKKYTQQLRVLLIVFAIQLFLAFIKCRTLNTCLAMSVCPSFSPPSVRCSHDRVYWNISNRCSLYGNEHVLYRCIFEIAPI